MLYCYSESALNYNANHQGLYINICGNNPKYWDKYLKNLGIKSNSILAGYTIYQYYLDKNGNPTEALKEYKGIKSPKKFWIIKKVKRVEREIKKKHLEEN